MGTLYTNNIQVKSTKVKITLQNISTASLLLFPISLDQEIRKGKCYSISIALLQENLIPREFK